MYLLEFACRSSLSRIFLPSRICFFLGLMSWIRLPRSGGVVFTIRTYFHPVVDICKEPYVPGRLASAVRSWGDDVSLYKGKEVYGDVLLEYLDRMHEEQVANGLDVEKDSKSDRCTVLDHLIDYCHSLTYKVPCSAPSWPLFVLTASSGFDNPCKLCYPNPPKATNRPMSQFFPPSETP